VGAAALGAARSAQAAGPTERRLHSDQVEASSFLWNDWNRFQENYHPNYVADDDPRTAWTEGAATSGAGEWLRVRTTELAGTTRVRLRLRNGYQKSARLFRANARAREVTIKLLPGGVTRELVLADQQGWQEIALEQPAGPLAGVEIAVRSVHEGTKYTDLCISDVQVFATSTARENPAFEKGKRKELLAWKAARVKAARLFRGKPADVPLHPAYQVEKREVEGADLWEACAEDPDETKTKRDDYRSSRERCWTGKALALARKDPDFARAWGKLLPIAEQALAPAPVGFVPATLAPTDRRPVPGVDGLYVPGLYYGIEPSYGYEGFELPILGGLAALRGESLRPLERKGSASLDQVLAMEAPGCRTSQGASYAWLHRSKLAGEEEGRDVVRALVLVRCGQVEVRDGLADTAQMQVLVYGDDGNLGLVAGPGYVNGFSWSTQGGKLVLAGGRRVLALGSRDVLAVASAPASVQAQ
jgi:hypothetical protein